MAKRLTDNLYREPKGRQRRKGKAAQHGRSHEPTSEELAVYADWIRGLSYSAVAEKYGYKSKSTVHDVCKKVNAWLTPQFMHDIRQIRCEHTQRLLHIYAEAMAAWERSKENAVSLKDSLAPALAIKVKEGKPVEVGATGSLLTERTTKGQCGNPTFLAEAREALADIRKLLGADAPLKVEHSGEIRVAGQSPDEARTELAAKLDLSRKRLLATSNN